MFGLLDVIAALSWGVALVSAIVFLLASDSIAFSHPKGNRVVDDKERYRIMVISGWLVPVSVLIGYLLSAMSVNARGY
ncbi:hypothetical protein [Arthrobacter mobilis]|uniref:Uncharacterized protein n=1 Tax=Arthrobacter mobilis TaxID=2724944 RepID=A0A7X6HBC8_9MICC|nr:hypothetical protein [Arthrobacter mobilis]NKX53968.1 hypothetical protein [Arthrobacter mobilis]